MTVEPWFDPVRFAWIPGAFLGVFLGILGGVAGVLAPKGKGRRLVMTLVWAAVLGSAALLVAGAIAFASDQPYGVWYGLGLAGLIGLIVTAVNLPVIRRAYVACASAGSSAAPS